MSTEVDFCLHLVDRYLDSWSKGRADFVGPFLEPVNEVRDNAPDYYTKIKTPMDLTTMRNKLTSGLYTDAQVFKANFDRMIKNCRKYNKENPDFVKKYADRFVKEIDWDWQEMGKWMSTKRRALTRQAAAPAPTTSTSGKGRYVLEYVTGLSVDISENSIPLCILMLTSIQLLLAEILGQRF